MQSKTRQKAIELARRPYRLQVIQDETTEGRPMYAAQVVELEGCMGSGVTPEAALQDAFKAMVDYIESLLEDDLPVPDPIELLPVSFSSAGVVKPQSQVETRQMGQKRSDVVDTEKPYLDTTLVPVM
jgi:predicted RNase H-like HicB family nuclease